MARVASPCVISMCFGCSVATMPPKPEWCLSCLGNQTFEMSTMFLNYLCCVWGGGECTRKAVPNTSGILVNIAQTKDAIPGAASPSFSPPSPQIHPHSDFSRNQFLTVSIVLSGKHAALNTTALYFLSSVSKSCDVLFHLGFFHSVLCL